MEKFEEVMQQISHITGRSYDKELKDVIYKTAEESMENVGMITWLIERAVVKGIGMNTIKKTLELEGYHGLNHLIAVHDIATEKSISEIKTVTKPFKEGVEKIMSLIVKVINKVLKYFGKE